MGTPTSRNPIQVGEENTLTLEIYDPNITEILDVEWYIEDPSIVDFKTEPSTHDRSITVVAKQNGTTIAGARVTYDFLGDIRTRNTSSRVYVGERTSDFTLSISKRSFSVGDVSTYTLSVRNADNVKSIEEIRWDITDTSIADFTETPGVADRSVTVKGLKTGKSHIYAEVVYNGGKKDRYGNGITVTAASSGGSSSSGSSSGGSGGGSGSSSSSGSSSRSGRAAQAAAPLPAVTPIVTDNNGVSHFGNAIIAQVPQNYSNADRSLLITSGTWSQTSNGYWQLNGTNAGNLRGRWALVSDALSQNPTGSASWFYFDNNGYAASGWRWIAGMDGVYRCYCFNQEAGSLFGACLLNGTTPDGYEVDATGAWTQNGIVMTKTAN